VIIEHLPEPSCAGLALAYDEEYWQADLSRSRTARYAQVFAGASIGQPLSKLCEPLLLTRDAGMCLAKFYFERRFLLVA
jgi:hypothetical protein